MVVFELLQFKRFFTLFAEKKGILGGFSDCIRSILKTSQEYKPFLASDEQLCVAKELNHLTSKNLRSYNLLSPLFPLAGIAAKALSTFHSQMPLLGATLLVFFRP